MKYLLDTHAWIWWHMNPGKLSRKALRAIKADEKYEEILLSTISLWEFCKLLEKKKIGISCNPEQWLHAALIMPKLRLVALSPSIAYRSTALPQPFHDDPADQIIVATAREEKAIIISKDARIRDYAHARSLW